MIAQVTEQLFELHSQCLIFSLSCHGVLEGSMLSTQRIIQNGQSNLPRVCRYTGQNHP